MFSCLCQRKQTMWQTVWTCCAFIWKLRRNVIACATYSLRFGLSLEQYFYSEELLPRIYSIKSGWCSIVTADSMIGTIGPWQAGL